MKQHIHILGICGTFMGGVAVLAKQKGYVVSGSDANVYPPMSTQLEAQGIQLINGYDQEQFAQAPAQVIVGNALSRGNPAVEDLLNKNISYISGPQWLAENILRDRWVLAVSGTHGKTTTSSMLAWILEYAGLKPGFLIGGIPENFGVSARLGEGKYFVIEADEYDTAFFDKRSKFVHYHPRTLILNNLEFDHADIFPDLNAIEQQFHFLVRTVPGNGLIVSNKEDKNVNNVLEKGCWTKTTTFAGHEADWKIERATNDGSAFDVIYQNKNHGRVEWSLLGEHNVQNALAAIAAAHHVNVPVDVAIRALKEFKNVKRRLEVRAQIHGVTVYDDFAHHPTAIQSTLAGLRAKVGKERILAVVECGSNTMRLGVHKETLAPSLKQADQVFILRPNKDWGVDAVAHQLSPAGIISENVDDLIKKITAQAKSGDHVVIMSNTGFGGLHEKLLKALK